MNPETLRVPFVEVQSSVLESMQDEVTQLRATNAAQADRIAELEYQLAELRQGGEAVGEVVLESMGIGDAQIVRFHMYKEIPPVGTKLYTQPAIPPGYVVVPDALVAWLKDEAVRKTLTSHPCKFKFAAERGMSSLDEVHEWMMQVSKQGEAIFDKYASAPAIQPQAATSVPVAEKDASEYQRGFKDGYQRRDDEVMGCLV